MTAKTLAILVDPPPQCHMVYPYADEAHIAAAVSMYASSGLTKDEAVVLITTPEKRTAIEESLLAKNIDVAGLVSAGRLVFFDADGMLCEFFEKGTSDATRFKAAVGRVIEAARKAAPNGKVRLYGEMVNLLCNHHNVGAAAELEDLWNETIQTHGVPLLCSYSLSTVAPDKSGRFPQRLLDTHSHVLAAA